MYDSGYYISRKSAGSKIPGLNGYFQKEDYQMAELVITKENFEEEVLKSDKPVLLDFWASWCGPCRMLSPVVSEIAEEHPEIKVGKINTDEQQELAMQYNIMSIPTLMVFKGGELVNTSVGVVPKQAVLDLLK